MGATYSLSTPCPREFRRKCCGHMVRVEERSGLRTQHPVVMDGLAFPSVRAAATFAGVSAQTFYMALYRGRTRAKGHDIRYAEEEA